MATLGQVFTEARQRKQVTASQAAAATRMKIQHIEALECGDFSRMAAPMYAKGFIRIYAEYLDLDPAPFIAEYMELHAPRERPPLLVENEKKPAPPRESAVLRFVRAIDWAAIRGMLVSSRRVVAAAAGVLLVVVVTVRIVSRPGTPAVEDLAQEEEVRPTPAPPPILRQALPVIMAPPEPYVDGAPSPIGVP